jgi:hypothetical protein
MKKWIKILWESIKEARMEAARARISGRHI